MKNRHDIDRIRFRATLRPLFCPEGPEVYLNHCKVLIKHFKGFAQAIGDRIKKLASESFQQLGRPQIYLIQCTAKLPLRCLD
jgi:hypothetical protein